MFQYYKKADPFDFQDLVAAVLRAMGFQAVSTDPGPDRGIDIVAHPDAFGFETPRIKAQVKHRKSTTGGPDMRSFIGTLRSGESGLYVSTGDSREMRAAKPNTPTSRYRFWTATGSSSSYWSTTKSSNRSTRRRFRFGACGCRLNSSFATRARVLPKLEYYPFDEQRRRCECSTSSGSTRSSTRRATCSP